MEEQRIGVYICWCGTNISMMVDVEKISKEIGEIPEVVVAKNYKYMCSDPGQDLILQDIKDNDLNRVVVAACTPRIHELTFRKALENAGLNPYMFEMANVREQCSWVHTDREVATVKALDLVRAAVNRVRFHEPLDKRWVDIDPATLIIGGGISGMSAALEIADAGKKVYLIEKKNILGGVVSDLDLTFPYMYSARDLINSKIEKVSKNPNIEIHKESIITEISGYVGNFEAKIRSDKDQEKNLKFGNIIVATGLKTFDPGTLENYQYGKLPDVITSLEFENMIQKGNIVTKDGGTPKHIAIIHCVGSRNSDTNEYCSRVCCMTALKFANQIRSALPDSNIYDIYADMRAFGKGCEELYTDSSRRGIMFMMFDQRDNLPEIKAAGESENCKMIVSMQEQLCNTEVEVPADLVILMVGMEAQDDAKETSHLVGVSMDNNGFFIEKHPKLDPVATTTDGVYIVGGCQSPKDIPDSVAQAKAAAARILGTILRGSVQVESTTATVNEEICCGCQTCISVCPYTAISFDDEKNISIVNEVLCKGCGTCGSACPAGAIRTRHFTDEQILSQIEGLMLVGG